MAAEALRGRLSPLPASPFASAALERIEAAAAERGIAAELSALLDAGDVRSFLGAALGDCPYLCDLACRDPARLRSILEAAPEARIDAQIRAVDAGAWETRGDTMAALRRAKQDIALTLGLADLARAVPLEFVTGSLTRFADAALNAALRFALESARRAGTWAGDAAGEGFAVLALGKHGAGELNYSSDIDIIALFDPDAPGPVEGVERSTFWVRTVRLIVAVLQERTAEGYVFRTDLRLRPDPGATAVALSAPAALLYYESMGQNWERAALIKARPAAGDLAAGRRFIGELTPFIWRRYLDFAAIADIHSIKRQTHAHRGHAEVRVRGHDIKRGRGGIREIEFFVQTQQLIAGGRDRSLRGRETRAMLARLAATGWIDERARAELDGAYVVLRDVEHRLQMVRDEQTHTVSADPAEIARIGRLMGFADADAFETMLGGVLRTVARRYSELFEDAPDLSAAGSLVFTGGDDDPETLETLRKMGFQAPEAVTATIRAWHFGRFAAMRSTAARENLTEITPALLQAFARAGNADSGLRAFDGLLKALPAGAQLFALLNNKRDLLDLLATILAAAPRLAETFARTPHVADALIDPASLGVLADCAGYETLLRQALSEARSYEEILNGARRFAAERRFPVSVGLLNGALDAKQAGQAFSDLAEAVVSVLFDATRAEFEDQHGRLAGGRCAVLALGRLGSREMTATSDLDLIVVYDHDSVATQSDGSRPLPPSQYYTRLTQRLTAALASPTAEGAAYAVDLRLRPSGRSGPLATHLTAFDLYQRSDAWTWETMAMSRGRPVAGDPALQTEAAGVMDAIIALPRDRDRVATDVAAMRGRIEREKPAMGGFDVKLARGGLVDCEFAAQFVVIAGLERRVGEQTVDILRRATTSGAVRAAEGRALVTAASLQSALLQIERVASERPFDEKTAPDGLKRLLAAAAQDALRRGGGDAGPPLAFADLQVVLGRTQTEARAALEAVLGHLIG